MNSIIDTKYNLFYVDLPFIQQTIELFHMNFHHLQNGPHCKILQMVYKPIPASLDFIYMSWLSRVFTNVLYVVFLLHFQHFRKDGANRFVYCQCI